MSVLDFSFAAALVRSAFLEAISAAKPTLTSSSGHPDKLAIEMAISGFNPRSSERRKSTSSGASLESLGRSRSAVLTADSPFLSIT